ncbi:MAG: ABC-F type ribosomal protection protein [Chloroflexota bacterium]
MTTVLSITYLSKTFGLQQVLNNVTWTLSAGDRVGLVGVNGAGKSTLLKIIARELEPDSGEVRVAPGMVLGYLPQTLDGEDITSIGDLIAESQTRLREMEQRLRALEQQMARPDDNLDDVLAEYGELAEAFERYGGYELDYRVDMVLDGLGVGHLDRTRSFSTLSGGEQARVGLALLLLRAPDILLLDEPTNHLDAASLDWLERYLAAWRGAMIVVSHDRMFLNRTVNSIVEIDEHTHTATRYPGDYDAYLQAKAAALEAWKQTYKRQQEELKALRIEIKEGAHRNNNYRAHTDNDKFIPFARRQNHDRTVSKRVRAAEQKLKRLEAELVPEPPEPLRFEADFDPARLKGRAPLYVSGLAKGYGERTLFRDVTFTLGVHSRIAITGPNGAGKSTLLRVLAGLEQPDAGEIMIAGGVTIGYLDQAGTRFDPEMRVLDAYRSGLPGEEQQHKATLLKTGLFRYQDFDKRVGELSSGQQRKLQIARLMAERANLLLLDEPTNYVSFDVLEAFEDALKTFPGPVIAVSHDRRFLERFGGERWELNNGELNRTPDIVEVGTNLTP